MRFSMDVSVPAVTVFVQGLLSFFSPCVLPLLPMYMGYLAGGAAPGEDGRMHYDRKKVMMNTLFFVIGVSFAFFVLGLGISAVGRFFGSKQMLFAQIGGVLVILFGLYQLGVLGPSRAMETERRLPLRLDKLALSPLTALLMGFVFSFAWTPCVGPTLSGVLLLAASASSRGTGFLLIGVYTMGFVIPFLAAGVFTTSLLDLFSRHRGVVRWSKIVGGVLLIVMGFMMVTGAMNGLTGRLAGAAAPVAAEEPVQPTTAEEPEEEPGADVYPAYAFDMQDQYGFRHRLEDYEGKVIFLNVWATWCPPCRSEMPDIQALYEKYSEDPDSEVAILGVAFPDLGQETDERGVTEFLAENGYTYPVLMDTGAEMLYAYGISAFPTTFMIDRAGNIYGYIAGALTEEFMESIIAQTLEEGA